MRIGPSRVGVVLFNLGGPDKPEAVRPFLHNLFADPAILGGPAPMRRLAAALIAWGRERQAKANYARLGGGSPLLAQTLAQARALEEELGLLRPQMAFKVVVAMRHWPPLAVQAVEELDSFRPDRIVLLPLYPQFSSTTTGSSLAEWRRIYQGRAEVHTVCCWPVMRSFVQAHADLIRATWEEGGRPRVRLLFSAHGLPKRVVEKGDPYEWQVETTCRAIAGLLGADWEWRLCYQSRVGPMKWLEPTTLEEIEAAAADGIGVLIDPVAFISEHVETLVELDHDYRKRALALGMSCYLRCATVQTQPGFISGLARMVEARLSATGAGPEGVGCPEDFELCGRTRSERDS